MQNVSFEEVVERIVEADPRYHADAYDFLREALDYTQQHIVNDLPSEVPRHVTGQQLLQGIRDLALRQFGPMTMTVLDAWGIRRCEDFGDIVFNLVEHRFLRKRDEDRREDFQGGYDFEEVFVLPFLPSSRRQTRQNQPAPRVE
ncbi:MAG: hypothetical protein KF833_20870 [Verrucomicrobiae bacterium]|nr:hypothetical protein [Verrucomicrobiae bacterium]